MDGVIAGLIGSGAQPGNGELTVELSRLVSQFKTVSFGHLTWSWLGNGANETVSLQQIEAVFDQDHVQSMAVECGMQPKDLLLQLSQ